MGTDREPIPELVEVLRQLPRRAVIAVAAAYARRAADQYPLRARETTSACIAAAESAAAGVLTIGALGRALLQSRRLLERIRGAEAPTLELTMSWRAAIAAFNSAQAKELIDCVRYAEQAIENATMVTISLWGKAAQRDKWNRERDKAVAALRRLAAHARLSGWDDNTRFPLDKQAEMRALLGLESPPAVSKSTATERGDPTSAVEPVHLLIDPGCATREDLAELFFELSKLYRMLGGSGIVFSFADAKEAVPA